MISMLENYKKFIIMGFIALGVLFAATFFTQRSNNLADQAILLPDSSLTSKVNYAHDLAGSIQEDIDQHSVKVANLDEAKKILPYGFPVPADTNGRKLIGVYIEDNSILYLRYATDIYVIYHKTPDDFDPKIDEALNNRPDMFEVSVRGQRGLGSDPGSKFHPQDAPKLGGTLGWYEKGLHIAIYSFKGAKVGELKNIAEAMKY